MQSFANRDPESANSSPNRDGSAFINTPQANDAKSKSNLIQAPAISLPKGGGAIKSIDEKFSVNAANGTAAFNIPLPFSAGRNNYTPPHVLSYDSGAGNGPLGLGWGIDVPFIQRKTDKKLPEYKDALQSDIFIFSGIEDLVPELIQNAGGDWVPRVVKNNTTTITYYRPRVEKAFSRIEYILENGNSYWRARTKENVVFVFGKTNDAKLYSPVPGEEQKIFRWCLEYTYDDKGNFVKYYYKKEDKLNIAPGLPEKNRLNDVAPCTNIYIKGIQYGNKLAFYEGDDLPADFLFELVFDYGEHDTNNPTTKSAITWPLRKDAFSDYRSGFDIRHYRLCRRALMFHHFKAELGWDDYLVRSIEFTYDEQPNCSYLEKITQTGYTWNTDGTLRSKKSLPPLEFSYFKPGFSREVKEITPGDDCAVPGTRHYQWADLYSEGMPGILSEHGNAWFYKQNLGGGQFTPPLLVSNKPSFNGLTKGTLLLQDLDANGTKSIVSTGPVMKGYFDLGADEKWQPFQSFDTYPNINLNDPNLKFLDLNGDGMPDILISHEQEFIWYASKGKSGYDDAEAVAKASDEEKGPRIVFQDKDEQMLIAIADMNGDGLSDIVVITYAGVCYYPNLGYGRFGARVGVGMNGCFDSEADFNPKFIHLADIDGSGTTDVVYTGKNKVQVWFNESGNNLSQVFEFFNPFPSIDSQATISFIDLLGNGTACMVWSSPLPAYTQNSIRYIDIMNGRKPHIMQGFKNNMGKEVTMEYKSSTSYYLADKNKNEKWITKLPFPVQCVSKVIVEDKVSQTRFTNEYSYHHGYYDAIEREFRGFARVEQRDSEVYEHYVKEIQASGAVNTIEKDLFQPATITKTWYHTGAFINRDKMLQLLREEYYPAALIKSGTITDANIISTLQQYQLQESLLPDGLSATEITECCRALKGLVLRQEIYSDEGDENTKQHPYLLSQHNYNVQLLQPKAAQKHAVFLPTEKEALNFHYERNPLDPRITHSINTETDQYGNVLQAASIVYGRKNADASLTSAKDKEKQARQQIICTQKKFTTPIDTEQAYRLPVLCETQTFELNTAPPAKTFFSPEEIKDRFTNAATKLYEQETSLNEKRKIEHNRILFLKNDLTGSMPFGTIDTQGLPFENYALAFTPTMLQNIYGGKFDESFWRNKARYVRSEGDDNYWIRSGRQYFHPDLSGDPFATSIPAPTMADVNFAKQQFYLPAAHEDNFGNLTKSFYDAYRFFRNKIIDAKQNETTVQAFNYRTLQPYLQQDANDNRTGVRFDELGQVTHSFVMGKENESRGDPMDTNSAEFSASDQPTAVYEYQFRYFDTNGQLPNRVKTSVRDKHYYQDPPESPGGFLNWLLNLFGGGNNQPQIEDEVQWQEGYVYCDGSGNEVLKKTQAEPGSAPERDGGGKLVLDAFGRLQLKDTSPELRWAGSGRKIVNNKGNTVKEYEPYFDSTPEHNNENELRQLGSTDIIFYDALSRKIKTIHANGSYAQISFDAWTQKGYDENDTVQTSQWYTDRINGAKGQAEQEAAQQAAIHHDTPDVNFLDPMGRSFLQRKHNKTRRNNEVIQEEFYYTRTERDLEGNTRAVTDARGNIVMSWKYDMLGNICYQQSMDGGQRWILSDARSKPLRTWDSRMQVSTYAYDELNRPLSLTMTTATGDGVVEQCQYGEGVTDDKKKNLRGKLFNQFDEAGLLVNEGYDFKGNVLATSRKLLSDYKNIPDWKSNPALDSETFSTQTFYDALNRPIQMIAPDDSIILQEYNEANLLNSIDVQIGGASTATPFVTNIDYNAKGQRTEIVYGNNTRTKYEYDADTFLLTRLLSTSNNSIVQDLNYTYDAKGNITRQFDNAQKTIFYGGQQVEAQSNYLYDALYRLIEANGREHTGQAGVNAQDNFNDAWCKFNLQPNSPVQLRNYTQKYFYDAVGNISKMQHIAGGPGNWTRLYTYNPANNQLTKTSIGGQNYTYTYNEHGSMLSMPHLQLIDWNFREELQHADLGGGGHAWYVYDGKGQRVRKVIELGGNKTTERIYIGLFEVYRERTGNTITLERETLHVADDKQQRIAIIDSRTKGNDGTVAQLIRYQYTDHLCSTGLELDATGSIISYEEYHPFGTTAYQATDASRQVPAKRYRYTGMERDEETGFNYHALRYYALWLGRWTSCDPKGLKDGVNVYAYVRNNPLQYKDPTGTQAAPTAPPPDSDTSVPPPPTTVPPPAESGGTPTSPTSPPASGSGSPAKTPVIDEQGQSDLAKAKVFLGLNALTVFASSILVGAAIGSLFGGIGAVVGAAIGAVVGFFQALIMAVGQDPDIRKNETYKDLVSISAWFNPIALISTAFGLAMFVVNLFLAAITFWQVKRLAITDFRFYHGSIVIGGGLIRFARAVTTGNVIHYDPDAFEEAGPELSEAILRHEWGHVLNNAFFGLFTIEDPIVENLVGQQYSLFERLAESNVNPNKNLPGGYEIKDERRAAGDRGFGTVPWWNP